MMTQFAHDNPAFELPTQAAVAERRRAYAGEVMADLAGATEDSLDSLPTELPVEAAVACGNCRLYGGIASQIVFPDWLATAAARRLASLLAIAADEADQLPELWAACTSDEAEDLVAGLLHARMDAWAASLQLDDVVELVVNDATRPKLEAAMDAFEIALERLDRSLDKRQDYLSTLVGTCLLPNLRNMLAPEYRDPLPWWLDGRLEAKAAEVDGTIDTMLDQIVFKKTVVRPVCAPPTLAQLRLILTQTYAAAAAPASGVEQATAPRLRWQSPDGELFAELIPPVVRKPVPDRIVMDLIDTSSRPALSLVGRSCTFAGVKGTIEQHSVDGEVRAVALFPGENMFGEGGPANNIPAVLTVDSVVWLSELPR